MKNAVQGKRVRMKPLKCMRKSRHYGIMMHYVKNCKDMFARINFPERSGLPPNEGRSKNRIV